ncbi:hypothetical protein Cfor_09951 [Coptotermes formosanus]|uniref:C3H1-type domain-containing protein n=1 Tax=Coptotermes formosanus TaxID=36987 RepID=A0A6L2PBU1_COPFO|nr:hypothetical protein Cfor_09951 [Coptotermes formosanus]
MAEDVTTLRNAISQYEIQVVSGASRDMQRRDLFLMLSEVQLAVSASLPGPDRDNLISLQSHIEELITLTRENLTGLQNQANERDLLQTGPGDQYDKEYALLKAELEELETTKDNTLEPVRDDSRGDIQEDLDALQGMKCQAPYKHEWGDVSYHNALVSAVEPASTVHSLDQIQDMLPCPYYLEGDCRFSDEQCHFCHGKLVDLASLKEYREPEFSAVRPGVQVLVKCEDCLWRRAVVLTNSSQDKWVVKLESSGKTMEVALHCILPLDHCMELKEKAGGDPNLFTVEKRLRRLRKKHEQCSEQQCEREKREMNVFDFINSKLGGKRGDVCDLAQASSSASKPSSKDKGLKSETCRGLNVVGFRVGEEIRRAEKDLTHLRESLLRHVQGSPMHTTIFSKMELKQVELDKLRASERSINLEQSQRKDRKKLTVF